MANDVSLASVYPTVTAARVIDVCKLLSEGMTLTDACQRYAIKPSQVKASIKQHPELRVLFEDAMTTGNDALTDKLLDINTHCSDPRMAGVISKNIQWVLAQREPARFADRAAVANNEQSKVLAEALNKAIDRLPLPAAPPAQLVQPGKVIDVEVVPVERVVSVDELRKAGLVT